VLYGHGRDPTGPPGAPGAPLAELGARFGADADLGHSADSSNEFAV
jgi:hypothetical protein